MNEKGPELGKGGQWSWARVSSVIHLLPSISGSSDSVLL